LHKLLSDPSYAQNATEVSRKLKEENGPARAADLIEQVLDDTPNKIEELAYASGD
jgi:UDP:flavonoid glycosyltransferase YjiC (YdhE family)